MKEIIVFLAVFFQMLNLSYAKKVGTVTIDSLPKAISPNGDGLYDKTRFIISADVGKIKKWALEIKNDLGVPVKTFTGEKTIPAVLEWNGTDEKNAIVPDGKYICVMDLDAKYSARSNDLWIDVDTLSPFVGISVSTYTISPNGDGIDDYCDISFIADDPLGFSLWEFSIKSSNGTAVVSRRGASSNPPKNFLWNGKDDYYKSVVPNGKYEISLVVLDIVGNKALSEPININVDVPKKVENKIEVKEEKRGLVVNLASSVLFDSGKAQLKPAAHSMLNEVVKLMQEYPDNQVSIEGHTDSRGSKAYNKNLSEKRAQAVYDILVSKYGVDSRRLRAVGYGEENPLASNKTDSGRKQNRRVEIIILKK
ncbi:MAG: OmpA family protein [Elusimicrobia bacterium]|nr:OmpA family protein [Elusimicrobiota bacterium]